MSSAEKRLVFMLLVTVILLTVYRPHPYAVGQCILVLFTGLLSIALPVVAIGGCFYCWKKYLRKHKILGKAEKRPCGSPHKPR